MSAFVTAAHRRLLVDAAAAGVRDSYAFAEWLVEERAHFGPYDELVESGELESAWIEAEHMWTRALGLAEYDRTPMTDHQIQVQLAGG